MVNTQYLTQGKFNALKEELVDLKKNKKPTIAQRIDEARQMGDLSENAEYHTAREAMSWTMSRIKQIEAILDNAEIITKKESGKVSIGSIITVSVNDKEKSYTIVGAQEADPLKGKISNESPLGEAFIGKKKGDVIEIKVPVGLQEYTILEIQ
jgi:transcription elongation factor GreA